MVCQFCHKTLGPLRRVIDREFCSRSHRKSYQSKSARAVRNSGSWDPTSERRLPVLELDAAPRRARSSGSGNVVLATVAMSLLFTAIFLRDGSAETRSPSDTSGPLTRYVNSLVSNIVPSPRGSTVQEDFHGGWSQWVGNGGSGNWSRYAGFVRPAQLKIWQPSASMTDYRFEFVGEIQQRGIGWAYRAKDTQNYYATEIVLGRTGPLPGADLIRYAILNGRELKKIRLPLPALIKRDVPYAIRMDVKGSQYTTSVDGHIVDTWSDDLLRTGGVGLFASKGQLATIRSASLAEYKAWATSVFSSALFTPPLL